MKNDRLIRVFVSVVLCMVFMAIPAGNVYAMPFNAPVNYNTVGGSPRSIAVGDFNLDGNPDLAVATATEDVSATATDGVSIFLGNGFGAFNPPINYIAGTSPQSVAVGDFNLDGKPDLAVANKGSENVSILLGNGLGTFAAAVNYKAGSAPYCVAVGDFNLDGKPDLAVANYVSNNVSILLGNGLGAFAAAVQYEVGIEPASVAVGDFNRDGNPDLAVAIAYDDGSKVSILLGNGLGAFAAAVQYEAGTNPESVAVGDFNLDGNPDLAVANYGSGNVSILLGNGPGAFAAAVQYEAGTNPASVAVGDFNLDGNPDLAVANISSSNVSILLNTPEAPAVTAVNPDSGLQGQCPMTVVLTGTKFAGSTTISFGTGITVNSVTVNSLTRITATICIDTGSPPGLRNISVTTPGGSATLAGRFTVEIPPQMQIGSGSHSSTMGNSQSLSFSPPVLLPTVAVQSASLSARTVTPGTPVTVTADITNKSAVNGNKKVTLYVNGQEEMTQGVTVSSGGSTQLTFNVSRSEPGVYRVYVDGVPAGNFKVELFRESDGILIISVALIAIAFLIGIVFLWRRHRMA
jgi:hypothetical protein